MKVIFNKKRVVVACTLLALIMLCCVEEYNPFDDTSNAQAHIVRTSLNTDTIPIFTTDSVELLFTVCNLIQKVSIQSTKNRYFDTKFINNVCAKEIVKVSFYDTGYQEIKIVTFRQIGDSVVLKKRYFVKTDLKQGSVETNYGDTISLKAKTENSKQDKDIKYIWKIGPVKTTSLYDSAKMIIDEPLKNDSGQLFICDNRENKEMYCSSPINFKAILLDPLPNIVIADGIDYDTLYTNSDSIDLKILIEKSVTQVNCYVNGKQMENDIVPNSFVKRIHRVDSLLQKLTIVVIDRTGKQTSRVVHVEFNSKKQKSVMPQLTIRELVTNGVITVMEKVHNIKGSVELYTNQKIRYTVSLFEINNKFIKKVENDLGGSFDWGFPVELESGNTAFRVELSDQNNNVIDDTTLIINYCKECTDEDPPVIASVLINDVSPSMSGRCVSTKKSVHIELICIDKSDIDSVLINNRLMKNETGTNYRWFIDTVVNHISNPDTFSFYAVDKKGNRSVKRVVFAGYNTSPFIFASPDSIEHTLSGSLYTSSIDIRDNDINDFVTYSIDSTDIRNIFIDEKGTIKWTPEKTDAGFHVVRIKGVDRNSYTVFFSYRIYVSETDLDTVKFVTSRNEFPNLMPCTDSISIPLKVRGGTKPFVFEITDRTKNNKPILVNKAQPYFNWKPNCVSDTGAHQFFIVVRDTLRLSDTIWPVVTVLPSNRDFEIKELRWSGLRKSDSALDLSRNRTDTLFYKINDSDNPYYERHTVEVTSGIQKYTLMADSGKFFIPLSHLARVSGRDSLVLIVKDKGNHIKKIVNKLDYGKPPLKVILLKPNNDSIIANKDILFRWSCSDPDGEVLKYHFTLQFIDGTFQVEKEVQDTFFTVTGLKKAGVYYWSVVASDSKSSTGSLSGKLTCLPPDRVRIDTTVSKLPELIQCKTPIKAPIVIKNGYPPFSFQCSLPIIVRNDSLVWIADCNKTGSYKINLMVKDSVGNTDTYTFNTSIYGSDSLDLKMVNEVKRNLSDEIDLSNPQIKTVVCTLAIIDPDPSPPEKFIVEVFLGNLQQQYFNNYVGRTFLVSLKPDISKKKDTLSVNVTDINGNKKNLIEILYYGD